MRRMQPPPPSPRPIVAGYEARVRTGPGRARPRSDQAGTPEDTAADTVPAGKRADTKSSRSSSNRSKTRLNSGRTEWQQDAEAWGNSRGAVNSFGQPARARERLRWSKG